MKTQIFINNTEIDIFDETPIPITFSVADIREPDKRNSSFSKTVTVPGSLINNKLFGHLWNISTSINSSGSINFNPSFNPNYKASALIIYNGIEQFSGIVQLLKINRGMNNDVTYDICFRNDNGNFFSKINSSYLSDLDLSEFNHTYTLYNQYNSWATAIVQNGSNVPFQKGNGYVYPMIDYGYNNGASYKVTDFFPALYVKTIVDKIFSTAGFQYESQLFNSDLFKSLVIPFSGSGLKISDTTAKNRGFRVSKNSNYTHNYDGYESSYQNVAFQDETSGLNWDTGNVFDNTGVNTTPDGDTYFFQPTKSGNYKISAVLQFRLTHHPATSPKSVRSGYGIGSVSISKYNDGTGATQKLNSTTIGVNSSNFAVNFEIPGNVSNNDTSAIITQEISWEGALKTNDYLIIKLEYTNNFVISPTSGTLTKYSLYDVNKTGAVGGSVSLDIMFGSYFSAKVSDTNLAESDTVEISQILPNKIKQIDFIKSIVQMFNLYIQPDPVVKNKLIIDPRNTFYSSGITVDWSSKLDYSQPIEITPISEITNKQIIYKYSDDTDYYNSLYKNRYNETYGIKRINVDNDFVTGEKVTEVIFSQTPLADNVGQDRILSRIFVTDDNGNKKPTQANIRILYYGGIKNTNNLWNFIATSGTTTFRTFPYAGHLNDTNNPTIDLCFGSVKEVFYTAGSYTDNNLYNAYYSKQINEQIDKDSKLVVAHFKLTPVDILNLDFRNQFYFDGNLFRLNKIYDYDITSEECAKCEFLLLKSYQSFISSTGVIYGGRKALGQEQSPIYASRTFNSNQGGNSVGEFNFIDPTSVGCYINGTSNTISANCTNVTIMASSGVTVNSGVKNVTVLNSSGSTINESDSIYINDIKTNLNFRDLIVTQTMDIPRGIRKVVANSSISIDITLYASHGYDFDEIFVYNYGSAGINVLWVDDTSSNLLPLSTGGFQRFFAFNNKWLLV